jgi:hypothetical protein
MAASNLFLVVLITNSSIVTGFWFIALLFAVQVCRIHTSIDDYNSMKMTRSLQFSVLGNKNFIYTDH